MRNRSKFAKNCALGAAGVLIAATVFLSGCSNGLAGEPKEPSGSTAAAVSENVSDARNTPVVRAAKAVGPAVVGITNKALARDWFNNPVQVEGAGSGVIFRKDGYIVTNNHVISGAKEIIVSLSDGRSLPGRLIGADELSDLAVVKVDADDLPTAEFGDSDDIMVGEPAIVIGNPMGLEFQGSVTSGVISALNRTLELDDRIIKVIQTDASINPGNSGGALVNADGRVIGINSAKIARSGVEGMGFAIPINTVKDIVEDLLADGKVTRPYLGVGIFDKETAARYGYILNVDKGVYVENVTVNGPAYKAGLRRGDIILAVDGKEVNKVSAVRNAVLDKKTGDAVPVKILRDGGEITVNVTLEAAS